jgi:hypothetical protein
MNNKNVIRLPASENFTPELAIKHVMSLCEAGHVADILMVGYDDENDLITFSSHMTRAEAVFLLEKAKEWAMYGGLK